MGKLMKGITYTFAVEWVDGQRTSAIAHDQEQAIRIAARKRWDGPPQMAVLACHATTEDLPRDRPLPRQPVATIEED